MTNIFMRIPSVSMKCTIRPYLNKQMKRKTNFLISCTIVVCLFILTSCQTEMDRYYEIPKWLKGNASQLLESKGKYSLFLEAVERAGYNDVISGKGIITVMAPLTKLSEIICLKRGMVRWLRFRQMN